MRFHHLRVTAFGPYAGTEVVDFDELNDAGVFLLTGPTGAGKTSILDAICFALYGVVPGERGVKALRSHHAPPGARPEVVLEVTIAARRFRIHRSPEWHRPKKRGEGQTKENASASLLELSEGEERLVSSRIQEVGHELGLLLGMSSEQFMQVVMLPQGEFQTFLRASSDERQTVLQKLFATQRFARIEEWMRDRTKELCAEAAEHERRVAQLLATIADRTGDDLPDSLSADRLGDVGERARTWTRAAVDQAQAVHERALHRERIAVEALATAETADREAGRLTAAAARRRSAELVLTELAASEPRHAGELRTLERHDRASLVRPLLQPLAQCEQSLLRADERRARAVRELERLPELVRPDGPAVTDCAAVRAAVSERLTRLRAAVPKEQALADTRSALATAEVALTGLRARLTSTADRAEQLPAERQELLARVSAARATAATLDSATTALEAAQDRHEAAGRIGAARQRHDDLADRSRAARDRAADARTAHLDVVERRLAGMAAELAGQLLDGSACQVCGSATHPRPAQPSSDAVSEEDQRAAQSRYELLQASAEELSTLLDDATRSLQQLESRSGGLTLADAAANLAGSRVAVEQAENAAVLLPRLESESAELDAEEQRLAALLRSTQADVVTREAETGVLEARIAVLTEELTGAVGRHEGTLAQVIAVHEKAAVVLDDALASFEAVQQVQLRRDEVREQADAAAVEQGFGSSDEAAQALLDPSDAERLREAARDRDGRRRDALAVLNDEEVRRLDEQPVPDLAQVRASLVLARETTRRCAAEVGSAADTSIALVSLADQLDAAIATWEPAREEHETAERMSKLVRGMGTDNQLQMRLSSYVLATRLDQVLAAANQRLAQMRDQRYALARTAKARGGTRAGLGLEVQDGWTGEVRDPCTLSGGETFVVSLALALGLADVVMEESGGLRVDTLFIDEGFGMLDPDTLDDVMDRIDALRAGGRTVGVVSHVAELRGRIPTQLHVSRGRTGSSVEVRTLVA